MTFDIADLVKTETPIVNCTLACSEALLPRIRFVMLGRNDLPRENYRIAIPDMNFTGKLNLCLGPGGGELLIEGPGPMVVDFRLWRNPTVRIGAQTTINGARIVADDADIVIGQDNMWSDDILLQSNDQHGIIDLKTGALKNGQRRKTVIGDHVWIGRRSTLMPDARIGEGSIVAAGAMITREVPPRCIYGGNPARLLSEDTSWSRRADGPTDMETGYFGPAWGGGA